MKIYIIRHGQSEATLDPTLFGRTDPVKIPLTPHGHAQAEDTGKIIEDLYKKNPELNGRKLRVYYSPYTRIVQSAEDFLKHVDKGRLSVVKEEPLLIERDHGRFNGLDLEQQRALEPELFDKLHHGDFETRYKTRMPDGESIEDVQNRMCAAIDQIKRDVQRNEDVVIITHGGNCKALEDMLTHYDATWMTDFKPPGTGDIIEVDTDLKSPGVSRVIHQGKKQEVAAKPEQTHWQNYVLAKESQAAREIRQP